MDKALKLGFRLHQIAETWINKINSGQLLSIVDLYPYSKINLKKAKNKRKFNKNYTRYVSETIRSTYWNVSTYSLAYNVGKQMSNFNLMPEVQNFELPKVDLKYFDVNVKLPNGLPNDVVFNMPTVHPKLKK